MPDSMSENDPAHAIVMAVTRVVPAPRWSFARVSRSGHLEALMTSSPASGDLARLEDEWLRQRAKAKGGSRIGATLVPPAYAESGVTLLFADAREDFGILTLSRPDEAGGFTSIEIGMLAFALDAISDRLSALQRDVDPKIDSLEDLAARLLYVTATPAESACYVLDGDCKIVLEWTSRAQRHIALAGLPAIATDRLPGILEASVRDLTAGWSSDASRPPGVAFPVPFLVVRTHALTGPIGAFTGVRVEKYRPLNSLSEAAARYHISPREIQVLALLLDGRHLEEIGVLLHITSSTVQDHIRSMIGKTASRNRSELIAQVLGWESTPEPRAS